MVRVFTFNIPSCGHSYFSERRLSVPRTARGNFYQYAVFTVIPHSSFSSRSLGPGVPPPLPLRRVEDVSCAPGSGSMAGNTGAWVAAVRGIAEGQPGPSEADPQLPCHVFHETTYRIPTPCDACHQPLRGDI